MGQQHGVRHSGGETWAALGLRVPECCGDVAHRCFICCLNNCGEIELGVCWLKLA